MDHHPHLDIQQLRRLAADMLDIVIDVVGLQDDEVVFAAIHARRLSENPALPDEVRRHLLDDLGEARAEGSGSLMSCAALALWAPGTGTEEARQTVDNLGRWLPASVPESHRYAVSIAIADLLQRGRPHE